MCSLGFMAGVAIKTKECLRCLSVTLRFVGQLEVFECEKFRKSGQGELIAVALSFQLFKNEFGCLIGI